MNYFEAKRELCLIFELLNRYNNCKWSASKIRIPSGVRMSWY